MSDGLIRQYCNELVKSGLLVSNMVIDVTYATDGMVQLDTNNVIPRVKAYNISPTLLTTCQNLGVVVDD